ncbi:MAG: Fic family protein [bacterium]|nr:Fic family protein [bacterium]
MATTKPIKDRLTTLKSEFDSLRQGKESLIAIIDESELPESVYNSNAIENSTLTLRETEKILLDMEVSRDVSVREVYEAKNLARVISYIRNKCQETEINKELILLLHQMLIGDINDKIAGRFRKLGEYVRVGTYIAPAPEHVERMIETIILEYTSNLSNYFLDKVAKFHLDFENIHPFNDGNGRIGRTLACFQLQRLGFPVITIRDKEKKGYYKAFVDYRDGKNTKAMEKVFALALMESLHKRITYLKGQKVITLSEYTKIHRLSASAITNAARRQNIPAFRENGVWKIGEDFEYKSKAKK